MALDPSLPLREAIVTLLRADAPLVALVPTARVYGEQPSDDLPERPFVRFGEDDTLPNRTSCWDGASTDFPVHSFSKAKYTDEVRQMNAAIGTALDGKVIELDGGLKARLRWLGSQVMRDGADPRAWHGINRFQAIV